MGWKEEEIGDFGGGVLTTVCFFPPGFETLLGRLPTTMSAQPDKGLDGPQGDKGRRAQAEVQPRQHQHGWSRVQHKKKGRRAAQEGGQGGQFRRDSLPGVYRGGSR